MRDHNSTDSSARPEQLSFPKSAFVVEGPPFVTEEQRAARAFDTFAPFWRLNDPLCARVLRDGLNPNQFRWTKAIFPLFREASLFQVPRSAQSLPSWQPFAFFAGREFGQGFPDRGVALLECAQGTLGDPFDVLRRLRAVLGLREANPWNLHEAFAKLLAKDDIAQSGIEETLIRHTSASFAAGLAAVTTAKADPDLIGFLARIEPRTGEQRTQLHLRSLIRSCADAQGRRVLNVVEHPLLKVAEAQYPNTPRECTAILPFFHEQLRAFGVRSENECPADDLALVEWVEAASNYGHRVLEYNTRRVKRVIAELGHRKVESVAEVIEDVLRRAKSRRTLDFTRAIFKWHEAAHRWVQPAYYGQALDRVVHCADFAIWAAWLGLRR